MITITIQHSSKGPISIKAFVFGEWAAHRCAGHRYDGEETLAICRHRWCVTYVPTGLGLPNASDETTDAGHSMGNHTDKMFAIEVARALSDRHVRAFKTWEKNHEHDVRWITEAVIAECIGG